MSLRLVIFDMDGVLVEACEWHRVALNEALQEVAGWEIPIEEHYTTFNGLPTKTKLNLLVEAGTLTPEQSPLVNELKQAKTVEIIERLAKKRNEKIELITWLKGNSINVACFTNSIRETATLMLEKTGVYEHLDMLVTNQDVHEAKPHPEGYLKILEHYKVTASETLIVEDSPKGLASAYASGCSVMEVKNSEQVTKNTVEDHINENFNSYGG